MTAERLGDRAIVLRSVAELRPCLEAIQAQWPDATDVVAAFDVIAVYFRSMAPEPELVAQAVIASGSALSGSQSQHLVPVCYELGTDFESIASNFDLRPEQLIEIHTSSVYRVEAIGFSPGFPYLSGLPHELQGLNRLESPRQRVDPGSIGIVEDMACIYPEPTPGGWRIVGRTPIQIVDVESGFFRFNVGDEIRFEPIDVDRFANWREP